jgi:NAD(P)H-dependent flavin oxidoreductase YrpB (nitropropane dioxygenase family)
MDTSEHSEGTIRTRLTELFRIKHPILCAPMALVTGGELAAAVSRAGGLGIVGGGYAGYTRVNVIFSFRCRPYFRR